MNMGYGPNLTARYTEMQVTTADRFELLVLLHKGAVKELKQAGHCLEVGNIEERVRHINRAAAIIGELQVSLDHESGGEIADSLDRLYIYMLRRLTDANLKKSGSPLDEVVKLLDILRSAWEEAREKAGKELGKLEDLPRKGYSGDRLTIGSSFGAAAAG